MSVQYTAMSNGQWLLGVFLFDQVKRWPEINFPLSVRAGVRIHNFDRFLSAGGVQDDNGGERVEAIHECIFYGCRLLTRTLRYE